MRLTEEKLTDRLIIELQPLLEAHKEELCLYEDFELDPDWSTYRFLEARGQFVVYTMRSTEDEALIGYAAYAIHQNMHYRARRHAIQDVLYIEPGRRGAMLGARLLTFADQMLKERGVEVVSHHVKVKKDFGPLLERLGYQLAEKIYERRL